MNPDLIQTVVARCLTDPDFLQRTRQRCDIEQATPEDAEAHAARLIGREELERMIWFRGFITKVKHNALRRHIPATLGLMGALGVELAFFCSFSSDYVCARKEGPLETLAHLHLLAGALDRFLDDQPANIAGPVAQTFAHELRVYTLGLSPAATAPSVPGFRWRGNLHLANRSVDVVHICERVRARVFMISDIEWRSHILAYWRAGDARKVQIFEIDALSAAVFSVFRDGCQPEEVCQTLAGTGLPEINVTTIRTVAAEAASRGLVELGGAWVQ